MPTAWSGDWKARVLDRAKRLGFADVWTFAQEYPAIPFGQLFEKLRDTEQAADIPIAYVQFQSVFFEDANYRGKTKDALMDTLVRRLRQHLSKGWNVGKQNIARKAEAIAQWELAPERFDDYSQIQNAVWSHLKTMSIPDDWCPSDSNDPILQEVFSRAWPDQDGNT